MRTNILVSLLLGALLGLLALEARAGAHEGPGGNVGVGLGVGAPTGLSIEVAPTSPRHSFELALGTNVLEGSRFGYMHLQYKANLVDLAYGPRVRVPLYLGAGAFLMDDRSRTPDVLQLGLRVPLGVNFDFQRAPVQIFLEAALLAPLFIDEGDRAIGAAGYGGVRVWF